MSGSLPPLAVAGIAWRHRGDADGRASGSGIAGSATSASSTSAGRCRSWRRRSSSRCSARAALPRRSLVAAMVAVMGTAAGDVSAARSRRSVGPRIRATPTCGSAAAGQPAATSSRSSRRRRCWPCSWRCQRRWRRSIRLRGVSPLEWMAVLLWAVGVTGEAAADRQLARFKMRPESRGHTCRDGLWRYSRHPNYFFEWVTWVAFALFCQLGSDHGLTPLVWLCPALMLYLLFRVTGIPATEAQAVRSRGDDYRRYQATTSAFCPGCRGERNDRSTARPRSPA